MKIREDGMGVCLRSRSRVAEPEMFPSRSLISLHPSLNFMMSITHIASIVKLVHDTRPVYQGNLEIHHLEALGCPTVRSLPSCSRLSSATLI